MPIAAGDDLEAVVGVDHPDDGQGPIRKKTICAVPVRRLAQLFAYPMGIASAGIEGP